MTSQTWQRRALFRNESWADLFLETLHTYRGRAYQLHEYVLMPEHFHILITPSVSLERAGQFIKGGFSFRVKKELHSSMEIWQVGFSDHRIRDVQDYRIHIDYIHRNPVGRKLVESAAEYPYCSAFPGTQKDEVPQWLKPLLREQSNGAPEGAPLPNTQAYGGSEGAPLPNTQAYGAPEGGPLPSTQANGASEGGPLPGREHLEEPDRHQEQELVSKP